MKKKLIKKMERFIELSKKFSNTENDLFPKEGNSSFSEFKFRIFDMADTVSVKGRSLYITEDGTVKAKDDKPLSRAEEIRAKADLEAKISNEFDEYLKLQESLSTFLKSFISL